MCRFHHHTVPSRTFGVLFEGSIPLRNASFLHACMPLPELAAGIQAKPSAACSAAAKVRQIRAVGRKGILVVVLGESTRDGLTQHCNQTQLRQLRGRNEAAHEPRDEPVVHRRRRVLEQTAPTALRVVAPATTCLSPEPRVTRRLGKYPFCNAGAGIKSMDLRHCLHGSTEGCFVTAVSHGRRAVHLSAVRPPHRKAEHW